MANKIDESTPQGTESPTLGDDRIREFKVDVNELLTVEHDISDDVVTSGFHGTNVTGKADSAISTPPTGYGRFGWKVISGVAELFYRDDAANEVQITSEGKLLDTSIKDGVTTDVATDLSGKSWFLDEDDMVSDDDTKVASQQSIVAYIAAQLATLILPSGLTGGDESNGETAIGVLEVKWGEVILSSSPQTHTFTALTGISSAFTNACFQVIGCPGGPDGGPGGSGTRVYDITTTGFKTSSEAFSNDTPLRFIAIGR
jgi:hypothetical protein